MIEERETVNQCYIMRERVGEDTFSEWWRASAIFVASNFLLRFLKGGFIKDEGASRAFLELARKRINIVSPAILSLVEIDRHKERFFIASEYDGHRNLRSILDSGRRFTVEHACRLVIELAEGVGTFHLRGEAFGVLTPEGIVVHGLGDMIDEIKLLLPSYEPFFEAIPETQVEDFKQAWGYASPEFKRGEIGDRKSDVYSLGVLLFRLLTGKLPYGSRSGILVRTRSASPAHVAAALARRGIPRELATTTVRALRKKPGLRHSDIMEFITELRSVLDVRREAWIKAGKVDPIADLATLNLKKAKADAYEIVRSLETVNYFRFLGDAGDASEPGPIETIEPDEEIIELEEIEASQGEDDESIATEAYIDAGYLAAEGSSPQRRVPKKSPDATMVPDSTLPDMPPDTPRGKPVPVTTWQASPPAEPTAIPSTAGYFKQEIPRAIPEPARQELNPPKAKHAENTASAPVYWKHSGGSPLEVADKLAKAVSLAAEGSGIVRFIQDPDSGESAKIIAEALEVLRKTTMMVDLGALPPGATIDQLMEQLENILGSGLLPGSKSRSKAAARRSALTKATRLLARQAADALVARAERSRPLVLIARGASNISPSAHRLIVELASRATHAPVCAFLFYGTGDVPKWHVLSGMRAGRPR